MMSDTVAIPMTYGKRNSFASLKTICVIDNLCDGCNYHHMLSAKEILDKAFERDTKGNIAKVLDLPPPRVTELYKGGRKLTADEAKKLIDHYKLIEPATVNESVCRLLVLHCASQLGCEAPDEAVGVLAKDLQAFLQFASSPDMKESLAEGFLAGISTARRDTQQRPSDRPS